MVVYLKDGFEDGTLDLWSDDAGVQVTSTSAYVHKGIYGVIEAGGGFDYLGTDVTNSLGLVYSRFFIKIYSDTLGDTDYDRLAETYESGASLFLLRILVYKDGSDLVLRTLVRHQTGGGAGDVTTITDDTVLQLNTWYSVEYLCYAGSGGTNKVWLNGAEIASQASSYSPAYTMALSYIYASGASSANFRAIDDCMFASSRIGCFTGGPYIGTVTLGDYVAAEDTIKPLNLPFARLNENIKKIIKQCHDSNYDLWECWMDYDDKEFHFAARKGSDKTGTISFIKGTNIGGIGKEGECRNAKTRVKVIGKSEGKKQDEISSDWQHNFGGEKNIGTFYEEILNSKNVADKETADVVANVEAKKEGDVEEIFEVKVTNDTYDSMAYDVGDDVTITDALTGMTGSYRIYSIKKKITKDGEDISLWVGATYKDVGDNWAEIRNLVKELANTGTVIEDWFGEGVDQDKLDAENISGIWEKSAKNDEQEPPADEADDSWNITGGGGAFGGQELTASEGKFFLEGSKDAGNQRTLSAYVQNTESTTPNILFDKNPRFKVDFKIFVEGTDPTAGATTWNDDDFLDLLFGNSAFNRYFGFYIIRRDGVYELWFGKQDAGAQSWIRATETAAGTQIDIQENTKYRLETEVIWEQEIIRFTFNGEFLGIMPFHATEDGTSPLFPVSLRLVTSNPVAAVLHWAKAYIYKWRSEWDWVA